MSKDEEKLAQIVAEIAALREQLKQTHIPPGELETREVLLKDRARENKHLHQELSRVTSVLDSKLNEVEELRAGTNDLQQQLRMREAERDLLAVMLNEAEGCVRRGQNWIAEDSTRLHAAAGEFEPMGSVIPFSSGSVSADLLEALPVGIMIVSPKGTIRSINKRFLRITGHQPSELIGKNISVLLGENSDASWEMINSALGGIEVELVNSDGTSFRAALAITHQRRQRQIIVCIVDLNRDSTATID